MAPSQDELDGVWRALSDPTRRRLLDLLRERPRTVGDLCTPFRRTHSRFAVMKHLGVLKQAWLVVDRKDGRRRWNHLNAVPLRRVYERWVTRYESVWAGALLGLERVVAAGGVQRMDKDTSKPAVGEFHIEQEVVFEAPLQKVWDSLLDVDGWWSHKFSKKQKPTLVLEPFAGGRFFEKSAELEAYFGTVALIKPRETLLLIGPLGMGNLPVSSVYSYTLEERGRSTVLKLSHRAYGVLDPKWHEAHEKGWKELWTHLKALAESGKRYAR